MSYLEMKAAPVENMSKAIISLWFRVNAPAPPGPGGVSGATPPTAGPEENWDMTNFPPPPNPYSGIPRPDGPGIPANGDVYILYNPYGESVDMLGSPGANPLIYPLIPVGRPAKFNAETLEFVPPSPVFPHDKFNVLMTFGNPGLSFEHRKWIGKKISTMDGVVEFGGAGVLVPFDGRPVPYNHYYTIWPANAGPKAGTPLGNDGKLPCCTIQLEDAATPYQIIPQSFIAVDDNKRLRIFLQTDKRATYRGYCYVQTAAKTLMMQYSRRYGVEAPIWTYWPDGGMWAGWEFEHKEMSHELMTQWPEYFMLQGPQVQDGWNHLLFSFDIDGTVSATQDARPQAGTNQNPDTALYWEPSFSDSCTTNCKAWLTLNNQEQTSLQDPHPIPLFAAEPGVVTGALPGQPASLQGGLIMAAFSPTELNLGKNEIVPHNVFARSIRGLPRYGLHHAYAVAITGETSAEYWAKDGTGFPDGIRTLYRGGFGGIPPVHNGRGIPLQLTTPNPKRLPKPSYVGGPFSIPTAGFPIGLPTGSDLMKHNMGCDQAELQVWIGQARDTETIKDLFVTANGKPVSMEKAWEILGVPQIVLHGSENWKRGKNTGAIGVDNKGRDKPEGQFRPTAKIEQFKPDPELKK